MPELPEVETIRQDLRKKVLNKKIVKVEVTHGKAVNNQAAKFISTLINNKIVEIERRGKFMIFRLRRPTVIPTEESRFASGRRVEESLTIGERDPSTPLRGVYPEHIRYTQCKLRRGARDDKTRASAVLVHLKMTGQLIYERAVGNKVEVVAGGHKLVEKDFDLPNKHTQVIITFADKGKLFFNDLRRFGYMKLASENEVNLALTRFGIEPLTKNFTWPAFNSALGKRQVAIKAALMDQPKIAGIGNIYADEVCWRAGIRPTRKVASLTLAEKKKLFTCIPKILKDAIKHRGTTLKDYLDSEGKKGSYLNFLKVYERDGQKCQRCGHLIIKIKSGGRGTHFCPQCQK